MTSIFQDAIHHVRLAVVPGHSPALPASPTGSCYLQGNVLQGALLVIMTMVTGFVRVGETLASQLNDKM